MQQSIHFGVYFLIGIELPLSAMDATLLRRLARMPKEHLRRVVLIDVSSALVEHLGALAVRLTTDDSQPDACVCATVAGWFEGEHPHEGRYPDSCCRARAAPQAIRCTRSGGLPEYAQCTGRVHAAILLEGRPGLQLLIAVFSGDEQQARISYGQLRDLSDDTDIPLMAVVSEQASFDPTDLPAGVSDWLYAAQIGSEPIARWRRVQEKLLASATTQPVVIAADVPGQGDYRYLFDESESEWLIVDSQTRCLLEVSPAVARHSRLYASQWNGLPLAEALQFEGVAVEQVLLDVDRRWFPCQRKSAQGVDTGQANVRRISHVGGMALALIFRSDRADLRAEAALSLLSRMSVSIRGVDRQMALARLMFDELGLDYLAVWSARQGGVESANQVLQLWSGDEFEWPAAEMQSSLQSVLGGKPFFYRTDAARLAPMDPLLLQLDLMGFAALR